MRLNKFKVKRNTVIFVLLSLFILILIKPVVITGNDTDKTIRNKYSLKTSFILNPSINSSVEQRETES